MRTLRHYLLAVQFFTRIPVTGRLATWVGYSPAMLRASSAHFPGVGWLVAAVAVGSYAVLWLGLGGAGFAPLAAAVGCTIATVLVTGGFHEDGLADVADGLGGAYQPERALEIMKDSRIGAFGAMALVLALLAKVALLAQLGYLGLSSALAALAGGLCCRACCRASSCARCRMWATRPRPRASRWRTRFPYARWRPRPCGVFRR